MAKDTTTTRATAGKATGAAKPRAKRTTTARPPRRRSDAAPAITQEQIALRAYEIHLAGAEGDAMAHWLRAERELVSG